MSEHVNDAPASAAVTPQQVAQLLQQLRQSHVAQDVGGAAASLLSLGDMICVPEFEEEHGGGDERELRVMFDSWAKQKPLTAALAPTRKALREAGAVGDVMTCVKWGTDDTVVCRGLRVLGWLGVDTPGSDAIRAAGGCVECVRRLREGVPDGVRSWAAWAIRCLVLESRTTLDMVRDAGAIVALVRCLDSASDTLKARASWALLTLSTTDVSAYAIREAGGIPSLVRCIGSPCIDVAHKAVWAMTNVSYYDFCLDAMWETNCVGPLLALFDRAPDRGKPQVLRALRNLVRQRRFADVICSAGFIRTLTQCLMDASSDETKDEAASVIINLTSNNAQAKDAVREAGTIGALVACLGVEGVSEEVVVDVAWALGNVASSCLANKDAIRTEGGIEALVRRLDNATSVAVAHRVASTLANIVGASQANSDAIRTSGGIAVLVRCLSKGRSNATRHIVRALAECTVENSLNKTAIRVEGGIVALVDCLTAEDTSEAAKCQIARACGNLAFGSLDNRNALREAGGIEALLSCLGGSSSDSLRSQVVRVCGELAFNNAANCDTIREAGGIPLIVACMKSASYSVRYHATGTCVCLGARDANGDPLREAGAVPLLLKHIRCGSDEVKEFAVWALAVMARNAVNCEAIRDAGGIDALVGALQCATGSVQSRVGEALHVLIKDNDVNKVAVYEAGGVTAMEALVHSVHEEVRDWSTKVLEKLKGGE